MTVKLTIAITISAIISLFCFVKFSVNTYLHFIANGIQPTHEYIDAITYSLAYAFATVFFVSLAFRLFRLRRTTVQHKESMP